MNTITQNTEGNKMECNYKVCEVKVTWPSVYWLFPLSRVNFKNSLSIKDITQKNGNWYDNFKKSFQNLYTWENNSIYIYIISIN